MVTACEVKAGCGDWRERPTDGLPCKGGNECLGLREALSLHTPSSRCWHLTTLPSKSVAL